MGLPEALRVPVSRLPSKGGGGPPRKQREYRMTSRASVLIVAVAATALTAASLSAQAAMPVGAPQAATSPGLMLAQDATATQPKTTKNKKSKRQQEIDKSVESGTVPSRYKSSVPKQYHHLIPFAK